MDHPARRKRRSRYNVLPGWLTLRRGIAGVLLAVLAIGGVYGVRVVYGLAAITHESPIQVVSDLVTGGHANSGVAAQAKSQSRINIALYGYGGPGHDGPYLTDSIMVVSILPQPNGPARVAELSVPRDWYVPIALPGGTQDQRINDAYAYGMDGLGSLPSTDPAAGATTADAELQTLLGIHIDYWIGVDFSAFKDAVDSVGGITVDVPTAFTDTQYPAGECSGSDPNCGYMTVSFQAGPQTMDGTTALEYARSRHGDNGQGSDFSRSQRQQLILSGIKSKIESIGGIGNLPSLLSSLGNNVVTNLTVSDMESLFALVNGVSTQSVQHTSFDDTNFLYECGYPTNCGAAYLFSHDTTYAEEHHFVANLFVPAATLSERAPITVVDASGTGNQASGRWASILGQLQLHATDGGTAPPQTSTRVIDLSGGHDSATAQWLAGYFGVTVTPAASASASPAAAQGGVEVILGSDEEQAFNRTGGPGF